jgi:undecaprenyl-diphosphatase
MHARSVPAELLAAAALAFMFAAIACMVANGYADEIDRRILFSLRLSANAESAPWLQELGRDITALGGTAILSFVTFAAALYLLIERRLGAVVLVSASVGGGMIVRDLLKTHFERPRPPAVLPYDQLDTWSFPSGHAMMSTIVYLVLASLFMRGPLQWREKVYVVAVAIALITGVGGSRVYLGLHWPSDVLAGWTIGAAWALFCCAVAGWVERARAGPRSRAE